MENPEVQYLGTQILLWAAHWRAHTGILASVDNEVHYNADD